MLPTYRRAALLTGASFTVLALAAPVHAEKTAPLLSAAAAVEGIRQDAGGTIAINLLELDAADPAFEISIIDQLVNPGGQASANAEILCGELSSACSQPGAIEQFANGSEAARNELVIGGDLAIEAVAAATGATATAIARIQTGILQQAVSGGDASNSVDISGSIDILASADAVATAGSAMVLAAITQAMVLSATGATSASIDLANSGSISIGVAADGSAQGSGSESAFVGAVAFGIDAAASATSLGPASIVVTNEGSIAIDADAHAAAPGLAVATAAALAGVNATAVAVDGNAAIEIDNAGAFSLSATAEATGGHTGFALANANVALHASANGFGAGDASVEIANSGSLTLDAAAKAQATTNANAVAIAATAIFQAAHAATGDAFLSINNVGSIEILADAAATGLIAQATAIAGGGFFGGGLFQSAAAASGNAMALIANDGDIIIDAGADANGSVLAVANAFGGPGIAQFAFADGGDASAEIVNTGTILLTADAEAVATGSASANAFHFRGVVGAAIADLAGLGADASAEVVNEGTIEVAVNAHALAENSAFAHASVTGLLAADAVSFGNGDAQAAFVNSGSIEVGVKAAATAATAFAIVTAIDVMNNDAVFGDGLARAELVNEGTFQVEAAASADGVIGTAGAFLDGGINQNAGGAAGADASISNSGAIELTSLALAEGDTGSAFAVATAAGIVQAATAISTSFTVTSSAGTGTFHFTNDPSGPVSVQLENEGSFSLAAQAAANGGSDAQAQAIVAGAGQSANGLTMDVSLVNSGSFDVAALADASASGLAAAVAQAAGIQQTAAGIAGVTTLFFTAFGSTTSNSSTSVVGSAMVQLDNSGTISVAAKAEAAGGTLAIADAVATGIAQAATGTAAAAELDNSGMIAVMAIGEGTGTNVGALANAVGVDQFAFGENSAAIRLSNSGSLTVLADARVDGDIFPSGLADAIGILQSPEAVDGSAEVVNEGAVTVAARVEGTGSNGNGQAHAVGIEQIPFLGEFTAGLDNSGTLDVLAEVINQVDAGGSAFAFANATGYQASGHSILADISNDGTVSVLASVDALAEAGSARANAVGLDIVAFADSAVAGVLEGSIVNSGMLLVGARVAGAGTQAIGSAIALSQASATGIRLSSGSIDAAVTNSGSIVVEAISTSGGDARAVGIAAADSAIVGDGTALLTIDNSGQLIARQSIDDGTTWHRGTAIDLSAAPNPSIVNLLGGGVIYGDITVKDGDEINVLNGQTYFNGIINPSFAPSAGVTPADLDSGLFGTGSLSIGNGGNLIFADPRFAGPANTYDGPSYAFVQSINVAAGGTLTIELQPASTGVQAAGSYSQLFADVANLDGSLAISLATPNGLFRDSYSWDNLIDANVRNGTFDQCVLGGPLAGSVLLSLNCIYDANANVDVSLSRAAFDSVAGLNRNGAAVGAALESTYDPSNTAGLAAPLTALVRINGGAAYNVALNQLSGSAYANYLQSFPSLGIRYNDLLDHGSDCEDQPLGGSEVLCRAPSAIHAWGQFDFERREAGGDIEAGTTRSRRATGVLGIDTRIGDNLILGAGAGYVTNHTRDGQFGDTIDGDGTLVGAYAIYDPGQFFVKAITSYSWFDGDSRRRIDFSKLAPAASFSARPEGDPNVGLFTAGLHGGARFPIGINSLVKPYLNLDFVSAELRAFSEAGNSGAELSIGSSRSRHTYLTSGVKWATKVGNVLPEANIGYRHRFDDRRATVHSAFFGVSGSEFDVLSAAQPRGSVLAGLGVGGRLGKVNVRIGYDGEFSSDVSSHSGKLKLLLPLGGS